MASQPPVMAGHPRSGLVQLANGQIAQSPIPPQVQGHHPSQQQPTVNGSGHIQQAPPPPGGGPPPPPQQQQQQPPSQQEVTSFQKLQAENSDCWLAIGKLAEIMGDFDRAVAAYDTSLRHNPYSVPTLRAIANLYRSREKFSKAVEYYQSILTLNPHSGETWGCLGMYLAFLDGKKIKVLFNVFVAVLTF